MDWSRNPNSPNSARSIVSLVPGVLLATACLIPFLNKAFTIDDPLFLLEANEILKTSLQPWSFPACWSEKEPCYDGN
jgi:hypothetical protein